MPSELLGFSFGDKLIYPSSRLVSTVLFAELPLPDKPFFLSAVLFSNIAHLRQPCLVISNSILYEPKI